MAIPDTHAQQHGLTEESARVVSSAAHTVGQHLAAPLALDTSDSIVHARTANPV